MGLLSSLKEVDGYLRFQLLLPFLTPSNRRIWNEACSFNSGGNVELIIATVDHIG